MEITETSYKKMVRFYAPLLLNTGVLVLIPPFINYGLSKTESPQISYGIFSAAFSIQIFLNGLVLTQKKAILALGRTNKAFEYSARFYLLFSLFIALLFVFFGIKNIGTYFFANIFNLDLKISEEAAKLVFYLSPTPLILSLRTAYQTKALLLKKTLIISLGTILRLILSLVSIIFLTSYAAFSVISAIALTYLLSYGLETLLLKFYLLSNGLDLNQKENEELLTKKILFTFSMPLWFSAMAWSATFPLINIFIGMIDSEQGIANFGVIRPLILFYGGPLFSISSLVMIFKTNERDSQKIFNFSFSLALLISLLIWALINFHLSDLIFEKVYKFPENLIKESRKLSLYFVLFPFLFLFKYYFEGICLKNKRSNSIGIVSFLRLIYLITSGYLIITYHIFDTGIYGGTFLMFTTLLAESFFLFVSASRRAIAHK